MKAAKTITPLTAAEIRAGIARLMASAFMTAPEGREATGHDFTEAIDATGQFRVDVGEDVSEIVDGYGVEINVACMTEDLAFALVTSRLTAAEIFTLGTSEDAIRLFEKSWTWQDVLSRRSPQAVSA
ncbi:MAG: hypothetical protein PHS14_20645 [Elusimicrobia bacterium]|nr:hypothetical protein [Elusimicrobiota bacterium]